MRIPYRWMASFCVRILAHHPVRRISDSLEVERSRGERNNERGVHARFEAGALKSLQRSSVFPRPPASPLDFTPRMRRGWKQKAFRSVFPLFLDCVKRRNISKTTTVNLYSRRLCRSKRKTLQTLSRGGPTTLFSADERGLKQLDLQ